MTHRCRRLSYGIIVDQIQRLQNEFHLPRRSTAKSPSVQICFPDARRRLLNSTSSAMECPNRSDSKPAGHRAGGSRSFPDTREPPRRQAWSRDVHPRHETSGSARINFALHIVKLRRCEVTRISDMAFKKPYDNAALMRISGECRAISEFDPEETGFRPHAREERGWGARRRRCLRAGRGA